MTTNPKKKHAALAPLRKVIKAERVTYPSTYPYTVELECGHHLCRERRPPARVRCEGCALKTKATGAKTTRVSVVGTPLSGTLSVEVAERGAKVNDIYSPSMGERAPLQLPVDVDGIEITVLAWPDRLVVFDEQNVLKRRKTMLYEFQNKVSDLLEKWQTAIGRLSQS